MFKYILLLFSLLSIIFTDDNFHRSCALTSDQYRSRPSLDTYAISPSNHFFIHYDLEGFNAPDLIDQYGMDSNAPNNIPDYIDEVALIADQVRDILVNQMNFLSETDDEDGIYDIYIKNKGSYNYGINFPDESIPNASYIEIDNKYEAGSYYTSGLNTMKLVVAHEFFHAIQRSYSSPAAGHTYFWEMTATWIEDIIVPNGDDYIFWVDNFFENPNVNISATDGYSIALFGHYLSNIIADGDESIIRNMWESYSINHNPFLSIETVLENDYQTNFQKTWSDFCSRIFFNGEYSDMNNNIYFHIDQKDILPLASFSGILSNPQLINENLLISDFILTNQSSDHIALRVDDFSKIILEHNPSSQIEGFISIIADNNYNKHIYIDESVHEIYLAPDDNIFLSYSRYNNGFLNINIEYFSDFSFNPGDCTLDQNINILDLVLLVELIFSESAIIDIQFLNSDMNIDNSLNIFDIILLIDLILN